MFNENFIFSSWQSTLTSGGAVRRTKAKVSNNRDTNFPVHVLNMRNKYTRAMVRYVHKEGNILPHCKASSIRLKLQSTTCLTCVEKAGRARCPQVPAAPANSCRPYAPNHHRAPGWSRVSFVGVARLSHRPLASNR